MMGVLMLTVLRVFNDWDAALCLGRHMAGYLLSSLALGES